MNKKKEIFAIYKTTYDLCGNAETTLEHYIKKSQKEIDSYIKKLNNKMFITYTAKKIILHNE